MSGSKRHSTQLSVYNSLRKSILTMNLLPGTEISENEISQLYEVSRTPVRETFIQLAKESLLQIIPQKGTRVSLIDLERMEQEYFLRKSLEVAVMPPFIKNASEESFEKLQQCIEVQKKFLDAQNYSKFLDSDNAFHKIIFETAGQNLSWEVIENFSGHYYRVRFLSTWQKKIASDIIEQHIKILEALRNKDLEKANERIGEHLLKLDDEKAELMKNFPDYFAKTTEKSKFDVDFGGLQLK